MSLFRKLFSKDGNVQPSKAEPKKEDIPWFSNAPAEWLPFRAFQPSSPLQPVELFAFFGRFSDIFERTGKDMKVLGMMSRRLVDAGVLSVAFHVKVDGTEYYIVIYCGDPQESANQYLTISRLHESGLIPKPLWFAPFELPPATGPGELNFFSFRDFNLVRKDVKEGDYATWWQTDGVGFADSPACEHLNAIYEASEGYYSYLVGTILKQVAEKGDASRTALPHDPLRLPVTLPNDINAILSVSEEKGIQLFFHKATTSIQDVHLVLKHYRKMVEVLRDHAQKQNWPKDPPLADGGPLAWWKLVYAVTKKKQSEGEATQQVGLFTFHAPSGKKAE
jgi:hypothetical protein